MARKEITTVICTCDICKGEFSEAEIYKLNVPVLFTTNQTDGYSCKPYYTQATLDFCGTCAAKVTRLIGAGAQGYNEYDFKKEG